MMSHLPEEEAKLSKNNFREEGSPLPSKLK